MFLSSSDSNCLKIEESNEDLLSEDDIWNTFSFDEQCKFAHGGFYKRYNGRYQGNRYKLKKGRFERNKKIKERNQIFQKVSFHFLRTNNQRIHALYSVVLLG